MKSISLLLFLLLAFSCQQGEHRTSSESGVAEAPAKIISLSGFLTELLCEMGHKDQLVGRDVTSTYPADVQSLPSLGHISQLNMEAVLALQPDVILLEAEQMGRAKGLSKLTEAGIQLISVPTSKTLDNSLRAAAFIREHLAGDEAAIGKIQAQITKDSLALAEQLANQIEKPRVLFLYARGAGRLMVGGRHTAAEAIIEKAGGQNALTSFDDYKPLTPEALVEAAPDVILMFKSGLASLDGKEGLSQITGISQTPAYQNDRIVAMDGHYLTAFGPRVGQAARELANKIHDN
ncbi:MAG: ABC transporter substrate-binding protein [Bacteroidota bacterium]